MTANPSLKNALTAKMRTCNILAGWVRLVKA